MEISKKEKIKNMKTTYKLYPFIREDKKREDGLCGINLYLRVGSQMRKIPTGKFVKPSEWNKKEKTAKSNSPKGIALASYLNRCVNDFYAYTLSLEAMGKQVTMALAMKFFETTDQSDFYAFWGEQIKMWEGQKKYNTLKGYKTTYNILKEISENLSFGDIDFSFIERFEHHLTVVKKNGQGGRFSRHKALRSMINQAIKKKLLKENPYKDFKIKPAKGDREFLTIEEITALMNLDLSEYSKNMNHARDMFVFSSLCGLRFSDMIALKYGDVKVNPDRLEVIMEKTSKPILIPLLPKAKEIIGKYRNGCIPKEDKNVFPNIANQTINKRLKDLMKLAGIDKHVSYHVSRHSFASAHLHSKTSLAHLQQLLGHSNIQDTMIYAKSLQEDIFASMDNLGNMYKKQEAV